MWYKDGIPIISTDKLYCEINGKTHTLKILKAELSDNALYSINFEGGKRRIMVTVEGKIHFFTELLNKYLNKSQKYKDDLSREKKKQQKIVSPNKINHSFTHMWFPDFEENIKKNNIALS